MAASTIQVPSLHCRLNSCIPIDFPPKKQPFLSCKASSTACSPAQLPSFAPSRKRGESFDLKINSEPSSSPTPNSLPDRWIADSVCDIVKNIKEAPFIHLLFDSNNNSSTTQRQRVPKGDAGAEERWEAVKDCVTRASPDGVILVRHLDEEEEGGCLMADFSNELTESRQEEEEDLSGNSTDMWGVLVLGRNIARSACYILKTTRVASTYGTCTHFCLTRAKCFGPSWHDQMQNSWLLGSDFQNRG